MPSGQLRDKEDAVPFLIIRAGHRHADHGDLRIGVFLQHGVDGGADARDGDLYVFLGAYFVLLDTVQFSGQARQAQIERAARHADADHLVLLVVQGNADGTAALAAAHQAGFDHKATGNEFIDDVGDRGLFQAGQLGERGARTDPLLPQKVEHQRAVDQLAFFLIDAFPGIVFVHVFPTHLK